MTGVRDTEARLSAALADTARRNLPDGTALPPFRPDGSSGRIRPWLVPALAAAVVIALTIGALALTNRSRHSSAPPAGKGHGLFITLRARSELSTVELDKARQVFSARAVALGASSADVQITGPDELSVFLPGVAVSELGDLVAADTVQLRPLVVDPVPLAAKSPTALPSPRRGPAVVDQWKSLGFTPPKDAAAYNALSPTRRTAVQAVLNNWDCTDLPLDRVDAPIVACDQSGTGKYLLGAAIISTTDIRSAATQAPVGSVGWQVFVGLTAEGQQRWTGYTTQHNESDHPGELANQVATTLDGVVIVASTIQQVILGDISIASGFDQHTAALLAAALSGGPLPARFDIVSIQRR